jgi:hypothetical protein
MDETAPAHVWAAMLIAAEIKTALRADTVEAERLGFRRYRDAVGATITLDIASARVIVSTDLYRLDLTVLPDRIAIAYQGDYGPGAITAMFILDYLHEQGHLPTDPAMLSAAQRAELAELRREAA